MLNMKIRPVHFASGHEVPVLVSDGVQVYETSWWLVDQLLPSLRGSAPNTMVAKMRSVAHWLQWAEYHKFNWAAAVQSGKFMSPQTIGMVLKWMELEVDLSGSERVKRLRVSPQTAAIRVGFLFQFLNWYANRLVESLPPSPHKGTVQEAYLEWTSEWKTIARMAFPRSIPTRPPETMGEEQRDLFLRVIRPGDPGNPWRLGLQVRNFALLMVLYEHGLRSSDVLELRMDDLRLDKGMFTIAERIADPLDTRARKPSPKRRGHTVRTLRFTSVSLDAMQAWLAERAQRDKWPGATRNAFVFLSHRKRTSKSLATRRPGQFFEDLLKAHPEKRGKDGQVVNVGFRDEYFHPHALRHDRAVRFVLDYDEKYGWDLRGEEAMRKVFGWCLDSRQPAYYAQAAHLAIGVKAMLELSDHRTRVGLAMEAEENE